MAKAAPKTKKAKGPKVGVAIRKTSAAPKKVLPKSTFGNSFSLLE